MNPSLDVIYAANLQPGDWWAGNFLPDAPTRPVQPCTPEAPYWRAPVLHTA